MSKRLDVTFASGRDHCAAWFYLPPIGTPAPCIVMAHGLGGTRDAGLEPFAERFNAAGYGVLLFDYRGFGGSGGEPRQIIHVGRQLQDWAAAIAHARTLPGIDPARIALWGTSFSGGHVIEAAARDGRVAAVSSQGPMMDGQASFLAALRASGIAVTLRMAWLGVLDLLGALVGMAPRLIPLAAPPGDVALMATHDALTGYRAIWPPGFRNGAAARFGFVIGTYRPGRAIIRVKCPVHMIICEHDSVAPAYAAEQTAKRAADRVDVKRYPIGHFDVYVGEGFERAVTDQLAFFDKHLRR